jgi:hypothetical protein
MLTLGKIKTGSSRQQQETRIKAVFLYLNPVDVVVEPRLRFRLD